VAKFRATISPLPESVTNSIPFATTACSGVVNVAAGTAKLPSGVHPASNLLTVAADASTT
jgi:hypothetical protein